MNAIFITAVLVATTSDLVGDLHRASAARDHLMCESKLSKLAAAKMTRTIGRLQLDGAKLAELGFKISGEAKSTGMGRVDLMRDNDVEFLRIELVPDDTDQRLRRLCSIVSSLSAEDIEEGTRWLPVVPSNGVSLVLGQEEWLSTDGWRNAAVVRFAYAADNLMAQGRIDGRHIGEVFSVLDRLAATGVPVSKRDDVFIAVSELARKALRGKTAEEIETQRETTVCDRYLAYQHSLNDVASITSPSCGSLVGYETDNITLKGELRLEVDRLEVDDASGTTHAASITAAPGGNTFDFSISIPLVPGTNDIRIVGYRNHEGRALGEDVVRMMTRVFRRDNKNEKK